MSAQQGGIDNTAVVETFKEALRQRVGADHFRMWFTHGVSFRLDGDGDTPDQGVGVSHNVRMVVSVRGQFALDRLRNHYVRELRAAAHASFGGGVDLRLDDRAAFQADLPLDLAPCTTPKCESERSANRVASKSRRRGKATSVATLIARGASATGSAGGSASKSTGHSALRGAKRGESLEQPSLPNLDASVPTVHGESFKEAMKPVRVPTKDTGANGPGANGIGQASDTDSSTMSVSNFIAGPCNQLACTALKMVIQSPSAASPLFLSGPSGTGKTHLLAAIAEQFRRRHRMRRVIHLSAEQFTNDFISSVGNSGIASFRRRYREVDALLVDDVQFLGAKRATLREMLYTVETLATAGRPMVFSGNQAPSEIDGLSRELSGRMASGLLCPIQPLDQTTRATLLQSTLESRCSIAVPDSTVETINSMLIGDGRVISGVANLINTLQRMYQRMPTLDEIRRFGGDLLRASKPVATLTSIEQAVCQTFQLSDESLRDAKQTRAVSEPRMLAMHLSRELTSAAYAEIGGHYGGRSHSTAIAARKNVRKWLKDGKSIGRGHAAMSIQEAIDRVESLLRTG